MTRATSHHNASPTQDAGDAVHFVDSEGRPWRVSERDTTRTPGARAGACLVFLSEGVARRSWHVPAGWRLLAPSALEGLMRVPG